ncbi:MAG: VWA domain-containing protein, partial [Acidobacteriota bacterium]
MPMPHRAPKGVRSASAAFLTLVATFVALAACAFAGGAVAQEEAAVFEDTTSVVVVEVPVNVVRDGQPVRGLTADDFEIYDGRRRMPIVDFEVVDLETVSGTRRDDGGGAVPMPARRHFLLLFDASNMGGAALRRSLAGARRMLSEALHPADLVGVGVYSQRGGAGLLLGFTPDRRQVRAVLDRLEGKAPEGEEPGSQPVQDPLRLVARGSLADLGGEDLAAELAEGLSGRGAMVAETLRDMSRLNVARRRELERSAFATMADALGGLADVAAGIDGRKFLVLFSRDWSSDLFFEENEGRRSLLDENAGARSLNDLQGLVSRFQQGGWTVQAVDTGGAGDGGLAAGGAFTSLARETGGEVFRNFGDLGTAMERMLDKTSVTYLLVFRADGVKADGAFHPIRVKLAGRSKGADLLHRSGYLAPSDAEEEDGSRRLGTAEMLLSGEDSGDLEVAALVAAFRGSPELAEGKSLVTAWFEVPGKDLLASATGDTLQLEVYAYILDRESEIHDFFSQNLSLDLSKVGDRLGGSALKLYGDFDLAPGAYDLRLLIRDPASGRHALRGYPFAVNPFVDGAARLLPPFFLDDDGEALVVRERVADGEEDRYPFVIGDDELFVPVIEARVDPEDGGRARICLMGYHLMRDDLLLDASLVASDGSLLAKDRLLVMGRGETGADGFDRLYFSLDATGLAVGDYQMLVSLHDLGRGHSEDTFMP